MSVPSRYFFAEAGEHPTADVQGVFAGLEEADESASETRLTSRTYNVAEPTCRCRGDMRRGWGWARKENASFAEARTKELEVLASERE